VALAGPDSVEVTWTRSPEADTKGYYVYRSANGGPFERQGDLVTLPTFSDRKAEHGKTYRYAISAIDQKGNSSENSVPADVAF
jgi:fibronectin type 3 domain-containing protein